MTPTARQWMIMMTAGIERIEPPSRHELYLPYYVALSGPLPPSFLFTTPPCMLARVIFVVILQGESICLFIVHLEGTLLLGEYVHIVYSIFMQQAKIRAPFWFLLPQ